MEIALAMIVRDKRVLIARRSAQTHLGGFWEFPGGKCLEHESLRDCVKREVWEETGLQVEITDTWPALTYTYPERTVTLHPFVCEIVTGNAAPLSGTEIVWAALDTLADYEFPAANASLIARLQTELE